MLDKLEEYKKVHIDFVDEPGALNGTGTRSCACDSTTGKSCPLADKSYYYY